MPSDMLDDNLGGPDTVVGPPVSQLTSRNLLVLGAGLVLAVALTGCTSGADSREMIPPSPDQTTTIPTTTVPPQVQESAPTSG